MRVKFIVRDTLAWLLGLVPLRFLTFLRLWRSRVDHKSTVYAALGRIFTVLRHRQLGSGVKLFTLPDHADCWFVNDDSILARRLYWLGSHGYEHGEAEWWCRFCKTAGHIVEVGANIGLYAVLGANAAPTARYVAVEPHPETMRTLRGNLEANGIDSVETVEAALVGNAAGGYVDLLVPAAGKKEAPRAAFVAGAHPNSKKIMRTFRVRSREAKQVISGADLLKLDVEGAEHAILSSVRPYILEVNPTLFVEVLPGSRKLCELLIELCRACSYDLYAITATGLSLLDPQTLERDAVPASLRSRDVILTTRSWTEFGGDETMAHEV